MLGNISLAVASRTGDRSNAAASCAGPVAAPLQFLRRPSRPWINEDSACFHLPKGLLAHRAVAAAGAALEARPLTGATQEIPQGGAGSQTALVLGCGIAGIAAAQALCPYFERVVVIERDQPEDFRGSPGGRRGAPQSNQPHVFMSAGCDALSRLFPGFVDDCTARGALHYDYYQSGELTDHGGVYTVHPPEGEEVSPLMTVGASRGLLESVLRGRLLQEPRVSIRTALISDLLWSQDRSRVEGVKLKDGEEVRAELVVDTTGFGSKTLQWLAEAGFQNLPNPEVISSGLVYVSCRYKRPVDWPEDRLLIGGADRTPTSLSAAILLPIENSEWMLICAGTGPSEPPKDANAIQDWIEAYAGSFGVLEALKGHSAISEARVFRRTDNVNRHLELVEMPEGLVALGDAACTFNPVYGQGMTVAVMGATLLAEMVAARLPQKAAASTASSPARVQGLAGLSKEFQARLAEQIQFPWSLSTSNDMELARAKGLSPAGSEATAAEKLLSGYMRLLVLACQKYWRVSQRFLRVVHMLEPPAALFHPVMLAGVLAILASRFLSWFPGRPASPFPSPDSAPDGHPTVQPA